MTKKDKFPTEIGFAKFLMEKAADPTATYVYVDNEHCPAALYVTSLGWGFAWATSHRVCFGPDRESVMLSHECQEWVIPDPIADSLSNQDIKDDGWRRSYAQLVTLPEVKEWLNNPIS